MKKASVLVVDDDVRILRMMQFILEVQGYQVLKASSAKAALDVFYSKETPELVVLDIMLPDMDGYAVCRQIREFSRVPIIMVTAKGNEEEKVEGLDAGADDYITKPFSANELVARARAVLRRTKSWDERPMPAFQSGELVIDFTSHMVTLKGEAVDFTATEYRILSYLARNAGRVVTHDQILQKVWDEEYIGEQHLLNVNISRLRKKLRDDPRKPRFITTKVGIGYMFLKPF